MEEKKLLFKNTWKLSFPKVIGLGFVILAAILQGWAFLKGLNCQYCLKQRIALASVGVSLVVADHTQDVRVKILMEGILIASAIFGALVAFEHMKLMFMARMGEILFFAENFTYMTAEQKPIFFHFLNETKQVSYWIGYLKPLWSFVFFFVLIVNFIIGFPKKYKEFKSLNFGKLKFAYAVIAALAFSFPVNANKNIKQESAQEMTEKEKAFQAKIVRAAAAARRGARSSKYMTIKMINFGAELDDGHGSKIGMKRAYDAFKSGNGTPLSRNIVREFIFKSKRNLEEYANDLLGETDYIYKR